MLWCEVRIVVSKVKQDIRHVHGGVKALLFAQVQLALLKRARSKHFRTPLAAPALR